MTAIDTVKSRIADLYRTDPDITANINLTASRSRKTVLSGVHAVIKGVYPNIFRIEEASTGNPRQFTFRYADVLTKTIEISELGIELAEEKRPRTARRQ
ncbi:MAG: hypothetical protein K5771_00885 [Oscillospiraceae bacterium]|nr:hypothetical protein [Oscillospiraceae bacterium]